MGGVGLYIELMLSARLSTQSWDLCCCWKLMFNFVCWHGGIITVVFDYAWPNLKSPNCVFPKNHHGDTLDVLFWPKFIHLLLLKDISAGLQGVCANQGLLF